MPIITISRGSYSKGKAVAEKAAQSLGYECISRDIILEASKEFDVPEIKLIRAIHDAPGVLDRLYKRDNRILSRSGNMHKNKTESLWIAYDILF